MCLPQAASFNQTNLIKTDLSGVFQGPFCHYSNAECAQKALAHNGQGNASTEDLSIMDYFWNTSRHLESPLEKKNHLHQSRRGQEDVQHKSLGELYTGFDIANPDVISTRGIKKNIIGITGWHQCTHCYCVPLNCRYTA